tara:strand:- start:1198 stop:1785 length:588 start_codon:yes stop_codon:yes gene_type:complete
MLKKIILQLFLLVFVLIICFVFFNTYFKKENSVEKNIEQIQLKKDEPDRIKANLIYNIEYKSNNNDGNQFVILSKVSELPEKNSNIVLMQGVEATINNKNSSQIKILSDNATFNKITYDTIFSENVLIIYDDHLITSLNLDLFFLKNLAIISNDIIYKNLNTTLQADIIEINLLTKTSKIFMNDRTKKIKILALN